MCDIFLSYLDQAPYGRMSLPGHLWESGLHNVTLTCFKTEWLFCIVDKTNRTHIVSMNYKWFAIVFHYKYTGFMNHMFILITRAVNMC